MLTTVGRHPPTSVLGILRFRSSTKVYRHGFIYLYGCVFRPDVAPRSVAFHRNQTKFAEKIQARRQPATTGKLTVNTFYHIRSISDDELKEKFKRSWNFEFTYS